MSSSPPFEALHEWCGEAGTGIECHQKETLRCGSAPVLWHNNNRREGYLFRASREWRRRKALFGSLWLRCFVHMCAATVTSLSLSPPTSSLYQLYLIASSRIGDKGPTAKIIQARTSFVSLSSTEIYLYVGRGEMDVSPKESL